MTKNFADLTNKTHITSLPYEIPNITESVVCKKNMFVVVVRVCVCVRKREKEKHEFCEGKVVVRTETFYV